MKTSVAALRLASLLALGAIPAFAASPATAQSASIVASASPDGSVPYPLDKVAVSTADLGQFPYVMLPDGYEPMNRPQLQGVGHFPFWTGTGFHWVEGKVWFTSIEQLEGTSFSRFGLTQQIEAELQKFGAVKVAKGKIPSALAHALPDDITVDMNEALGDIYNNPVETWVIRRNDRAIWIHFTASSAMATLTVVETGA
ncbi:hypothetical protein KY084_10825 [Stakelama sp. CBK3Z-3]|uniref:DUF1236 domain-containing protein n=1 Tax=Stakelama flava TaxID=2860338 RepID=A0ABS6XPM3_9SPHN|nr:hypothetical protein [Stakelama flava]MBW4331365.1 hypothetical protein [Stakelama flava]